jgi:hypothetical protein
VDLYRLQLARVDLRPDAVYGVGGIIAIYANTNADSVSGVSQITAGGAFGSWITI